MVKIKPVSEVKEQIRILDEDLYDVLPNPDYVKGMIMGLADAISYECDKPNCISEEMWNNAKKSCKEKLSTMKSQYERVQTVADMINEVLGGQ